MNNGGWCNLERVMGIEPTFLAWEANVLPLNYTRKIMLAAPRLPQPSVLSFNLSLRSMYSRPCESSLFLMSSSTSGSLYGPMRTR